MKNKKGFTLVEIIVVVTILVVVAGIFAVNMINTLNKNKDTEKTNMITTIKSAADVYISANPERIEDLYNGYGFIDFKINELIEDGLINSDMKNPSTGDPIDPNDIVRAEIDSEGKIEIIYPVSSSEQNLASWKMRADDIIISYDKNTSSTEWCSNSANVFKGVYSTSYYTVGTSKVMLINGSSGQLYSGNYLSSTGLNLMVDSCNVNPMIAGTYEIDYTFIDPTTKNERNFTRKVLVQTSNKDVISITAIINGNRDIILGETDISVTIQENYKDNTHAQFTVDRSDLDSIGYTISNLTTSSSGTRTANISSIKTNSDGSTPAAATDEYKVTASLVEVIEDSGQCTSDLGKTECYYRGVQENNYVKYNNYIYRVYYKKGTDVKLIYDDDDIVAAYSQVGSCTNNSCCNSGRYVYSYLGDNDVSRFSTNMDSVLENFVKQRMKDPVYLQSQSTKYGYRKIALLALEEYNEIIECSNCRQNNYLLGKEFWLINQFGDPKLGDGSYNEGRNAASAYNYTVKTDGSIGSAGSQKESTKKGDFGITNVVTDTHVVKPTIELRSPLIVSGNGSKTNPYVVG